MFFRLEMIHLLQFTSLLVFLLSLRFKNGYERYRTLLPSVSAMQVFFFVVCVRLRFITLDFTIHSLRCAVL